LHHRRFINFAVDIGIVQSLKSFVFFITDAINPIQHIVPPLQENMKVRIDDDAAALLFFPFLDGWPATICPVVPDNFQIVSRT
jgi:hypothetical protein